MADSFSVAVPTYNGVNHIRQALESVMAQEVGFELLVCDDRSDDQTLDVVRSVAGDRARIIVNSERLGLAGNWNRCVDQANNELVAIFHQDDVMHVDHLTSHVQAFASDAEGRVGMVASDAKVIDENGSPVSSKSARGAKLQDAPWTFRAGELPRELIASNPIRCSAVTLRKQAHETCGGFIPTYRYIVDWEFWRRLSAMWDAVWLPEPTVSVRRHSGSETHRFEKAADDLEEMERFFEDVSATVQDVDRPRLVGVRRALARAYLNRAYSAMRNGEARLAKRCWKRSRRIDPKIWRVVAADPRLCSGSRHWPSQKTATKRHKHAKRIFVHCLASSSTTSLSPVGKASPSASLCFEDSKTRNSRTS